MDNISAVDSVLTQPTEMDLDSLAGGMGLSMKKPHEQVAVDPADVAAVQGHPATAPAPGAPPAAKPAEEPIEAFDEMGRPINPQGDDAMREVLRASARGLQNAYNGAIELTNALAELTGGVVGKPAGDLIPSSARLDLEALRAPEDMNPAQKFGNFVGQIAAPIAAGVATGGGALAQLAVGGAVDFMVMDPNQERLTTMLTDNYPEFRQTAVMGNMLQWLGEDAPGGDSEIMKRTKNMVEGVAIGGSVTAAAKVFGAAIKTSRGAKKYLSERMTKPPVAEPPAASAVTDAADPAVLRESEVAAAEARMGANASPEGTYPEFRPMTPDEAAQANELANAGKADELRKLQESRIVDTPVPDVVNPAPVTPDGRVNVHSTKFDEAVFDPLTGPRPPGYESRTWAQVEAGADEIAKRGNPEDAAAALLKRDARTQPYTQEEALFLAKYYAPRMQEAAEAAEDALTAAVRSGDDGAAAEAYMVLENARSRADLATDLAAGRNGISEDAVAGRLREHASEAGARLNLQKQINELAGAKAQIKRQAQEGAAAVETELTAQRQALQEVEARAATDPAAQAQLDTMRQQVQATEVRAGEARTRASRAGDARFQDQYDLMRDTEFREELRREIMQKYGGVENIKQLAQHLETMKTLGTGEAEVALREIRNATKTGLSGKTMELITSYSRNAMLSSPKVAMGVFMENISTAATSVMNEYMSNVLQGLGAMRVPAFQRFAVTDKSAAQAFHAANDYALALGHEFFQNVKGVSMAWQRTSAQMDQARAYKQLTVFQSPMKKDLYFGINSHTQLGKMLSMGGKVLDNTLFFGTKLVGTSDAIFAESLRNAKLRQLYQGEARQLIERGDMLAENASKYVQGRLKAPLREEWESANAFAREHVMMSPSDAKKGGIAGQVSRGVDVISGANSESAGVRAVLGFLNPFVRTAYNVLDFSMSHTLLAPLWNHTDVGRAIARGGEEGALAMGRMMTGTSLLAGGAVLAANGIVTGSEPDNPRLARALRESNAGWQPNSVKIGGTYVSLAKLGVFGRMLRMSADLYQTAEHLDENTALGTTMLAATAFTQAMDPTTMVRGMGELYTILSDPMGEEAMLDRFARGQVNKVVPSVVGDLRKAADPFRRDTTDDEIMGGIKNAFRDRVPYWSREGAVQRNIWGEPLMHNTGSFAIPVALSQAEKGSAVKEVLEKMTAYEFGMPENEHHVKLALSMPPRVFESQGTKIRLSNEEYEKYVLLSSGYMPDNDATPGKEKAYVTPLKDVVEQQALAIYDTFKGQEVAPVVYKSFVSQITKTVTAYRRQARELMLADPEFGKRFAAARQKQLEAQSVGF